MRAEGDVGSDIYLATYWRRERSEITHQQTDLIKELLDLATALGVEWDNRPALQIYDKGYYE